MPIRPPSLASARLDINLFEVGRQVLRAYSFYRRRIQPSFRPGKKMEMDPVWVSVAGALEGEGFDPWLYVSHVFETSRHSLVYPNMLKSGVFLDSFRERVGRGTEWITPTVSTFIGQARRLSDLVSRAHWDPATAVMTPSLKFSPVFKAIAMSWSEDVLGADLIREARRSIESDPPLKNFLTRYDRTI